MNLLKITWNLIDGNKTFGVAFAGVIWGIYQKDTEVVLAALALAGIRDGMNKI